MAGFDYLRCAILLSGVLEMVRLTLVFECHIGAVLWRVEGCGGVGGTQNDCQERQQNGKHVVRCRRTERIELNTP